MTQTVKFILSLAAMAPVPPAFTEHGNAASEPDHIGVVNRATVDRSGDMGTIGATIRTRISGCN
jgi:hypothetical protein